MTMAKRVFLTGATGFVGSNLARLLVKKGYEVHISLRKSSDSWRIRELLPQLKSHALDLTNQKKVEESLGKIKPDIIFHLANLNILGGKQFPDLDVINVNLIGLINLLNATKDMPYRCFINTGSSSEYGPKPTAMKESDSCNPTNTYGITKLAATQYAREFAMAHKKPILNLRLFSPFGPYDDPSRLMTYAINRALQNKPLKLANKGSVRDYIYVENVAQMYLKMIKGAARYKGETFNLGSGQQRSVLEVVEGILSKTQSKSKVEWNAVKERSFDSKHWKADMGKTKRCFGEFLDVDFDEGLQRTIEWFRLNHSLYHI